MSRLLIGVLGALVVLAMLGSCGDHPGAEVLPPAYRTPVRVFVHDHNCRGLQALFDHSEDPDVMTYLDRKMREMGCY